MGHPRLSSGTERKKREAWGTRLQHLHHQGNSSGLRFAHQDMKVLRHHDKTGYDEVVSLPDLFQNVQKQITVPRRAQELKTPVATARDEVKVSATLNPAQSLRDGASLYSHDCERQLISIPPFLRSSKPKSPLRRKDGAASRIVRDRGEEQSMGHPPCPLFPLESKSQRTGSR
jgi:hypothetical protein